MLAGRICQNLIFISFFQWFAKQFIDIQTATESQLNDGPFVYDRSRPAQPPVQIVILKNFVTTEFQCDVPVLYLRGTLQLRAIAGLMYIFTT